MTKPVRFGREAREELQEAAEWYESRRTGLRAEFLGALDEAIARLQQPGVPLARLPGVPPDLGVKRVFLRRFPYAVIFIEMPTRIRVIAVAHQRRRPGYWRGRT